MTDFTVYIPSKARQDFQFTYNTLPDSIREKTVVLVPEEEKQAYLEAGIPATARPRDVQGIHNVWRYIYGIARTPVFFILDDDLSFFRWIDDNDWHLTPCAPEEVGELFDKFLDLHDQGFKHATLSTRQMNNNKFPNKVSYNGRANAFHMFDTHTLRNHNIDPSKSGLHDIHTTLSLFALGYPNAVINNRCWNQARGSGATGGCSTYRDGEWQHREVMRLYHQHPDFVKVVYKTPKQGWGEGMKTRTDVTVYWKRAAKAGGATRHPTTGTPL